MRVVNFEDQGPGAEVADLVFNALYPPSIPLDHVRSGAEVFCLRDEFLHVPGKRRDDTGIRNLLITFGGVDDSGLATRVLASVLPLCREHGVSVTVISGPGCRSGDALDRIRKEADPVDVQLVAATGVISEYMIAADAAVSSAGRTALELASLGVPTITIAQNERETHHTIISAENGFICLGPQQGVSDAQIAAAFERIVSTPSLRQTMVARMRALRLHEGTERVASAIRTLLRQEP
jgi:spore coat polysaccharide biosynthesis predicted glycosyltransferase SpsG